MNGITLCINSLVLQIFVLFFLFFKNGLRRLKFTLGCVIWCISNGGSPDTFEILKCLHLSMCHSLHLEWMTNFYTFWLKGRMYWKPADAYFFPFLNLHFLTSSHILVTLCKRSKTAIFAKYLFIIALLSCKSLNTGQQNGVTWKDLLDLIKCPKKCYM